MQIDFKIYTLIFFSFFLSKSLAAQGKIEDYKRANAVDTLFKDKVFNSPRAFHWINETEFWYKNNSKNGEHYLLVNADLKSQKSAFNHKRLAKVLSVTLEKEVKPSKIDIYNLNFLPETTQMEFQNDSLKFRLNLSNYQLAVTGAVKQAVAKKGYWGKPNEDPEKGPVTSPNGHYIAFIKNFNLFLKHKKNGEEDQLSFDGSKGCYYSPDILWSPDSKKIMAYKVNPGQEHKIYFVASSPEDQIQPKLQSRDYLKPGDELDFKSPQLFHVEGKKHFPLNTELFNSQYALFNFQWFDDSSAFTFEYNQRGHQVYRILKVNAETGEVQAIIDETSPTFIHYSGKRYRYDVKGDKEILWASERDGYNHLYLYNSRTGELKNQVTSGKWPVREVLEVDQEKRQIYFTASGLDKGQDPYLIHYCRIDFDGKNFTRFTSENGNHKVVFSPDHRYYVDQYSRVDSPAVTVLKEVGNPRPVMELQTADISELQKTKWNMPEVFTAKGRDGKTDIWGVIIRPTNFDPAKTYPIIEYIYAGPHSSFVPKEFNAQYNTLQPLAELGFIVVQIDGMGTSNRSKAFHDVCWKNLKDSGFPDRKLWIKAAAKKYPYMDLNKVGIRGTSAGGQSAGAALVFHSDFYDVAVASCGCHDNRMDKIWWNEQWMGYPVGPHYEASSNVAHADKLKGNLMLIVGEVDDNVDPASTMQFADALIKVNKDFELVVLPGESHTSGGEYGERKRRDFFVEHLLDVKPPSWEYLYKD